MLKYNQSAGLDPPHELFKYQIGPSSFLHLLIKYPQKISEEVNSRGAPPMGVKYKKVGRQVIVTLCQPPILLFDYAWSQNTVTELVT